MTIILPSETNFMLLLKRLFIQKNEAFEVNLFLCTMPFQHLNSEQEEPEKTSTNPFSVSSMAEGFLFLKFLDLLALPNKL